jgi:FkbM family methyltransferase
MLEELVRVNKQWPAAKFLEVVCAPECRVHFSQFGEDAMLAEFLKHKTGGFYVDVGCHDPFRYSNTYLLHKLLGWRGINIDADINAIKRFEVERPGDVNLNVGIGLIEGRMSFTTFADGAVNTFDAALAARQKVNFGEPRLVDVSVRRLSAVLSESLPPETEVDYLNVDCEGLDEEVLRSNDWSKFRPKVVTVELHGIDISRAGENSAVKYLSSVGYRLTSFYWVTALFLRND